MDSFVFVQIASLCLSDQKDVSLCPNIPYHYTGAGGAAGRGGGWAGARGCPSECPAPPSRRTSPTPTAKQRQTHAPLPPFHRSPSHGHLYSTSHSSGGFFQDVPRACSEWLSPNSPTRGVCLGCKPGPPGCTTGWRLGDGGRSAESRPSPCPGS